MNTEHLHHHTVNAGEVGEDMSHGHVSVGAGTANLPTGRKVRSPVFFPP